jgi:hypothetical protein
MLVDMPSPAIRGESTPSCVLTFTSLVVATTSPAAVPVASPIELNSSVRVPMLGSTNSSASCASPVEADIELYSPDLGPGPTVPSAVAVSCI